MTIYASGKSGTIGRHLSANVKPVSANLQDDDFELQLPQFETQDSLIHLAGIVGAKSVEENLQIAHKVNVEATLKLASHFIKCTTGRFIFASTAHVYVPSLSYLSEQSELEPINVYASQKLEAERGLIELFKKCPDKLCIVRIFSVLDWQVPQSSLGGAIAKLADQESNFILANASDIRDFLTPQKIAFTLEQIAKNTVLDGVVNLCSSTGITVAAAVTQMLAENGYKVPINRIQTGNSPIPHIVGNNSKLVSAMPELDMSWIPSRRY